MDTLAPDLFQYRVRAVQKRRRPPMRREGTSLRRDAVVLIPEAMKEFARFRRTIPLKRTGSDILFRLAAMRRYRAVKRQVVDFRPAQDDILGGELLRVLYRTCDARYACYVYPGAATVAFIQSMCRAPLLEIGAGTGTWTHILASLGIDAKATDLGGGFPPAVMQFKGMTIKPALPVEAIDGRAAVEAYADRDVLLVMPDPDDGWYVDAVRRIAKPGRRLFILPDAFFGNPMYYPEGSGYFALHACLHDTSLWKPLGHSTGREKLLAFERL